MKKPDPTAFWGARYEVYVAATMIRAGYRLEYEDESDGSSKHPEFIAVHKIRNTKIAVEAKKRNRSMTTVEPEKIKMGIKNLLNSAVKKSSHLPFLIFLELDLPPYNGDPLDQLWAREFLDFHNLTRDSDGKDFPNIIVFTNNPPAQNQDIAKSQRSYIITKSLMPKVFLANIDEVVNEIKIAVDSSDTIPTDQN